LSTNLKNKPSAAFKKQSFIFYKKNKLKSKERLTPALRPKISFEPEEFFYKAFAYKKDPSSKEPNLN